MNKKTIYTTFEFIKNLLKISKSAMADSNMEVVKPDKYGYHRHVNNINLIII